MENIIQEKLPPTVEFAENLCNGVYLAKLAHFISPGTIPLSRIYDQHEHHYKSVGLQFRHTDNINYWLCTLETIKLPKKFHPVTTDVYNKKNIPRLIYSLHALAAYLHLLGKAEKLEVLINKELFSDEDVAKVKNHLKLSGLKIPSFYEVERILIAEAGKTSSAGVVDVNNALLEEDTSKLMDALKNPLLDLNGLDPNLALGYFCQLQNVRKLKNEHLSSQPTVEIFSIQLLNLVDIQDAIHFVNVMEIWKKVELAVENNDECALLEALQYKSLDLKAINPNNISLYLAELAVILQNPSLKVASVLDCKILLQQVINTGSYSGFKTHQEHGNYNPGSPRAA